METREERNARALQNIYTDANGFMSRKNLYKEAVQTRPRYGITMHFVNQWYDTIVGRTRNYGPHNSFVAPHAHWEYQIDLFQLSHLGSGTSTSAMACIDVFSRYATVVPIPTKQKRLCGCSGELHA